MLAVSRRFAGPDSPRYPPDAARHPDSGQSVTVSRLSAEKIEVGRTTFAVRRTTGRGHPVVLLHGLMDSAEGWDPFALSLSRPTLAFDLPGFGESEVAGDDLDLWAHMLTTALGDLGIESCYLLGHSLGGALATATADVAPGLARKLLLIAPAGFGRLPLAQILGRPEVEFVLGRTAPGAMRFRPLLNLAYRGFFSHDSDLPEELRERLIDGRETMVPGIRQGMHVLRRLSLDPVSTSDYTGPVDVLLGRHDHMVPLGQTSRGILRVFPEARITEFDDVGHHPQAEKPDLTLRWIAGQTDSKITEPLMLDNATPLA
jgi:pimeloyl-ACP methyl ester carboxylesterase